MNFVEVSELTKYYPGKTFSKDRILALDKVSFTVGEGEIFGLLGPNGAGKTTLVKILLGIVHPTTGTAGLLGKNLSDVKVKSSVGYLPENHKYPQYLSAGQLLEFYGKLSGMNNTEVKKRSEELLKLVDMEKWKTTKIRKYSKGMMQRVGLAQALINNPKLIFLDEPTDGVDPIGRKHIRDVLIELRNQGKTIFLNSHMLSEIEMICDRVVILNKGSLIKEGNVKDIITTSDLFIFNTSEISDTTMNILLSKYKCMISDRKSFTCKTESLDELNMLIDYLRSEKILIENISKERNTLEKMFINLIEHQN